jgi:5-histidylcysteine sulfoxide synthase/putative 4-mercaptohistidine N1-methyltranferase
MFILRDAIRCQSIAFQSDNATNMAQKAQKNNSLRREPAGYMRQTLTSVCAQSKSAILLFSRREDIIVFMIMSPTRTLQLNTGSAEEKRQELLAYFHATCDLDEALFKPFASNDAFYIRAEILRHPLIFYLGHTAVFYINKLIAASILTERINPKYESLFAIGVDEMSWDDLNEAHYDWPTVEQVMAYRRQVRETVDRVIRTIPLKMPIAWNNPAWALMMGMEHARIHLETSSVIIRQLPIECVSPHPLWPRCAITGVAPKNALAPVSAGTVTMGKSKSHPLYGWDNEFGLFAAEIPEFWAGKYLVSNQEFLEFVEADGYQQRDWWTEEGWKWKTYRQAQHPIFWIPDGDTYRLRTMLEIIDMPWDWPVEVNYLEAKAFCNWKSAASGEPIRLPTEEEWRRIRDISEIPDQPYWKQAPGNINLEHYASSCPVGLFRFGELYDVIGNVWQWTETPIYAFNGFEVHPYYDDFSTPTFDDRHNLIKGGSWISTGNEATQDSRYAFRRHFFQHAGFRYVKTEHPVPKYSNVYETDALVSQYAEFHYGKEYFGVENFPGRCARVALERMQGKDKRRALDLGCAVGRATFELGREFAHVTGLDYSARFIKMAVDLREKGRIRYVLPEEGEIVSYHEKHLSDFGLEGTASRVEFFQADACNLKPLYAGYDLVLACNLIDRLYNPAAFLSTIHERIMPGGLLILTSPYTWLEEFTKRDQWLGGFRKDGENVTTLQTLNAILSENFASVCEPRDIAFVIRETGRKFQHTLAQMTVWERK